MCQGLQEGQGLLITVGGLVTDRGQQQLEGMGLGVEFDAAAEQFDRLFRAAHLETEDGRAELIRFQEMRVEVGREAAKLVEPLIPLLGVHVIAVILEGLDPEQVGRGDLESGEISHCPKGRGDPILSLRLLKDKVGALLWAKVTLHAMDR
jgi:hypothetical protein